jgi:hypothetical protein
MYQRSDVEEDAWLEDQISFRGRERNPFQSCDSSHSNVQHECLSLSFGFVLWNKLYDEQILVGAQKKWIKNSLDELVEIGFFKDEWRFGLLWFEVF